MNNPFLEDPSTGVPQQEERRKSKWQAEVVSLPHLIASAHYKAGNAEYLMVNPKMQAEVVRIILESKGMEESNLLLPNQKALDAAARKLKRQLDIPGVVAVDRGNE